MAKLRLLTDEEKSEINHAITRNYGAGDREPRIVIKEDYGGDIDHYMRVMAGWHHIPIGIDRIFLRIKATVGNTNVGQNDILQIIGDLSREEVSILIAKLNDLRKAAEEEAQDSTSEIVSAAQSSHQFSPQGMSSGMADFYDNEVSAVHIGARKTFSEIDQVVKILTEISETLVDNYHCQTGTETLSISLGKDCVIFSIENPRKYEGKEWIERIECSIHFSDFKKLMENLCVSGYASYKESCFDKEPPFDEPGDQLCKVLNHKRKEQGQIDVKKINDETITVSLSKIVDDGFFGPNGGSGHSHWEFGKQEHSVPLKVFVDFMGKIPLTDKEKR